MSKPQVIEHEQTMPAVQQSGGAITPMEMVSRAVASGASIETLERLMALNERYQAQQAKAAFDEAMAAAKAEIPVIFKNRTVDFTSAKGRTNYRHEDLAGIARTVDPILTKHGLSYRFRTSSVPSEPVTVTCIVSHRAGHSEENTLSAGRDDTGNKNSIQQIGSTITYLQRYTLKAALGLSASTDDDGAKADEDAGAVTMEQAQELLDIINKAGADVSRFCTAFNIEAIPDLPAKRFDEAKQRLSAFSKKGAA